MAWPKGVPRTAQGKKPRIAHIYYEETVSAGTTVPPAAAYPCRVCEHGDAIHYEGRDRQCNTSGCRCARYTK